jgi:hypothetical protein
MNTKALALSAAFSLTALNGYAVTTRSGLGLAYEAMDDATANLKALPGNTYSGGWWQATLKPGAIDVHGTVFVIPDTDGKVQECTYNTKTYHFFGKKIKSTKGELKNCHPAI